MRKANWHKLCLLKGSRPVETQEDKVFMSGKSEVILPTHGLRFEIDPSKIPSNMKDEKQMMRFQMYLKGLISNFRKERKLLNEKELEMKTLKGVTTKMVGKVREESGTFLEAFHKMISNSYEEEKKPKNKKDNYVGLELEIIYSGDYEKLKSELTKQRLYKEVTLSHDGSVKACHNSGYTGLEVKVLTTESNLKSVLDRLDIALSNPDVDGYANRSCGLHVHIDMRNRDHKLAFKNLVRCQDLMRAAQPKGRLKNQHCLPNESDEFQFIDRRGDRFDRYWVVNPNAYRDHNTLEVRVHEGTVSNSGIFNWVNFLLAIVEHKEVIPKETYKLASDLRLAE